MRHQDNKVQDQITWCITVSTDGRKRGVQGEIKNLRRLGGSLAVSQQRGGLSLACFSGRVSQKCQNDRMNKYDKMSTQACFFM